MSAAPDTANHFGVSVAGNLIVTLRGGLVFTREEALNLAAWIVALADREDKFPTLLAAVRNT
jgi:hypothetical protein